MWFGAMRAQVTCAPAPSPAGRSRWRIAISHSWTSACPPTRVCSRRVLDGAILRGGRTHGLLVGPRRRDDAAAAFAVGEHRQADAAVDLLDGRQHLVADVGDAGVEVFWIGLDGGGPSVHGAVPTAVNGGAPVASPRGSP